MNNRIISLIVLILLTAVTSVIWWKQNPPPAPKYTGSIDKLILALPVQSAAETNSVIFIAESNGYFKDLGLEVLINDVPSTVLGQKEVIDGKADIASVGDYTFAAGSFNEGGPKIIASIDKNSVIEIIGRIDKGINVPADLKGKKIATFVGSNAEFFLHQFLLDNNLADKDVEIVPVSSADDLISAVATGRVDGASAAFAQVYKINKILSGGAALLSGNGLYQSYNLLIAMPETLKNRPEVIERFLRALILAEDFIATHELETKAIIQNKFSDLDKDYIANVWPKHNFEIALDQTMLITLENEARWQIKKGLTDKTKIPNYLNGVYFNALAKASSKAITIIH